MAIASTEVRAECIEATEFPELAQRYQVMAVPKIVINDRVGFEGAIPEREFLGAVLQAVHASRRPERDGIRAHRHRRPDRLGRAEPLGAAALRHPDLSLARRMLP